MQASAAAEAFDPTRWGWVPLPSAGMLPRRGGAAVAVAGGIVVAGGDRPEAELFDEASGAWLMLPHPMAARRRGMVFTTLPAASNLDGRAMAAGAHLGTLNW
jgi:hypothetical protein